MGFLLEFLRPIVVDVLHYYIFAALNKPMPANIPSRHSCGGIRRLADLHRHLDADQEFQVGTDGTLPGRHGHACPHRDMHLAMLINAVFVYVSFFFMKLFGDNVSYPNMMMFGFVLLITMALGLGMGLVMGAVCRITPLIDPFLHILLGFCSSHPGSMGRSRRCRPICRGSWSGGR